MERSEYSEIFIGKDGFGYSKLHDRLHNKSLTDYFSTSVGQLFERIIISLIPPIVGLKYRKIYVDFLGPMIAVVIMSLLLVYGYSLKTSGTVSLDSPLRVLILYISLMPCFSYVLSHLGQSRIAFLEIVSLIGYSLFGHVLTLGMSFLISQEKSNSVFFICFFIFGGLSALRVALVLLATIPSPAARLLVCSVVSVVHLLFLIFLHFTYMHKTFVYGLQSK